MACAVGVECSAERAPVKTRRSGVRNDRHQPRFKLLRLDDHTRQGHPKQAKEAHEGLNTTLEVPLDILEVLRARKKAWKIPELTELLNLGKRTLYDEVEAGRLPALRIGTAIRINPSDAVIWVDARITRVVYRAA